jgi:alpha-N-arabinofuranosidase
MINFKRKNMPLRHLAAALSLLAFVAGCGTNRAIPPAITQTSSGNSSATDAPAVTLDARSSGPTVSSDLYGASLDTWYDFLQRFVNPSLRKTGIHLVRFPGGSESDAYHWSNGGSVCDNQGYITPPSTFDHLMTHVAGPLNIDIAITLNYGSNRACNGGGEPSEAGAWVAHAKSRGYHVAHWTVGNEVYGSWEYDLHAHPHDPHTYADAVRTGYYPAVKSADPQAKLGVVVDTPDDRAWNDVVLREAGPFDFVELHYYPEYNNDNDQFLLGAAIDNFGKDLDGLRAEMTRAGVAKSVPIYLGEYNNDAGNEGKQSVSIVNGLFVGQMLGTLANAGVPMSTFWLAYGSCDENGDFSKKLYGWQHFGTEALFSDGLPNSYEGCANTPKIPGGTSFPTAHVMALMASGFPQGSNVRSVSLSRPLHGRVRAYGVARDNGFTFALYNNTLSAVSIRARVRNSGRSAFAATLVTYGKSQYDKSKNDQWVGPVTKMLGNVGPAVPLSLPPYSLSILSLQ